MAKFPKISVIIPTFNEEKNIIHCLRSVRRQDYSRSRVEIVVVDQESSDKTLEIARKFGCRIIKRERPKYYTPPSISRNMGANGSSGEYLFHLDADMRLHDSKLFAKAMKLFSENKEVGALVIHERDLPGNYWARCIALERKCYVGTDMEAARLVRRDVFEKVGGYDEKISSGEDWDIDRRYRRISEVVYSGLYLSHDIGKVSFWKQLKKKAKYGRTGEAYFRKHGTTGFSIASKQLLYFFKSYKLLMKEPLVTVGMVFVRFCEYIVGFAAMFKYGKK